MSSGGIMSTMGIYEPVAPPRYPVSATDQGAFALIASVIMVAISGLAVFVKLHMTVATFRKLRADDIALISSLVFAVAYTVTLCRSVQHGLGRAGDDLTDGQTRRLGEFFLASNVLHYPSLACSKCSLALLVIAIQPARWMAISLYTICAVSSIWAICAVVVTAMQCGPDRWALGPTDNNSCIDQYAAKLGLGLIDIATDIALAVLPGIMMLSVQVSWPKRATVASMFGLRILTPIFTALALAAYADFYAVPTSSRAFGAVTPSIWTSVAVSVSLITACIPSIKRFLMDWAAGVSNNMVGDAYEWQHTSSGGKSRPAQASGLRSYTRSRMNTSSKSRGGGGALVSGDPQERTMYSSYAHGGSHERDAVVDDGDSKKGLTEGIIQTRDVHVQYEEEQNSSDGRPSPHFRRRM